MAWRRAFEELYGIPADIGEFTDAGMTDPDVGARTFEAVMHREPTPRELAQLIQRRLEHLPEAVAESEGYRVLPGVPERLRQLSRDGHLLGLITGNGDGAAHVKLARGDLNRWFTFGAYASAGVDRPGIVRRAVERGEAMLGRDVPNTDIYVVGDTPLDISAAHAVGCTAIARGDRALRRGGAARGGRRPRARDARAGASAGRLAPLADHEPVDDVRVLRTAEQESLRRVAAAGAQAAELLARLDALGHDRQAERVGELDDRR